MILCLKLYLIDRKNPHDYLLTGLSYFSDWKPGRREKAHAAASPAHQGTALSCVH